MTRKEFENLKNIVREENYIKVSDLKNQENRTLIYGYDKDRIDFHLYLKNGEFYFDNGNRNLEEISKYQCVPNKRVYPEKSDYEFCKLLKERGINIPFTIYR